MSSPRPTVVLFSASWCKPCKAVYPALGSLAIEMPEVDFGIVDIDEEAELALSLGIMAVPTLKVYVDEGKTVAVSKTGGMQGEGKLREIVAGALSS